MIDKNLYCETFSQLHASEEAKKEVFQNMQEKNTQRKMPKFLQTSAIAAAMVCIPWPSVPGRLIWPPAARFSEACGRYGPTVMRPAMRPWTRTASSMSSPLGKEPS